MNKTTIGKINYNGFDYKIVGVQGFPFQLWETEKGKLCRVIQFIDTTIAIEEGMGTIVTTKSGFMGFVLHNGYNFETGEIQTDAGVIKIQDTAFLKNITIWEDFIFHRKYSA